LPDAGKALADGGIKFLARGGKTIAIEGQPPQKRMVIGQFESREKAPGPIPGLPILSQKDRQRICVIPRLGH